MRKNNKGYSLVELIIVVAIMAILTGVCFFSVAMIFNAGAKTCANNIKEAIAENKVTAMGKSEAMIKIYKDASDGCIYSQQWVKTGGVWDGGEPEQIGNSRVYVAYVPEGGSETELTSGASIEICFDRGSGSFRENDAGVVYSEILVQAGRRKYHLTLTKLTGKVSIELENT